MTEPADVFQTLIDGVTQGRWDELPMLYAEDAVVDHPFLGRGQRMHGREALHAHFAAGAAAPLALTARNVVIHRTADPEVIIAEFEYHGQVTTTGRTFAVPNIFVLRIRDGLIAESRDYGHHLALALATDRVSELLAMYEDSSHG